MLITPHRLPGAALALLAAGRADPPTMRALHAGQLSKHAVLLRAVLAMAEARPREAAAAGLTEAVQLLDQVQRRMPEAAAEVLGYPLVGAWAAHCLRRLRRPDGGGVPLWADLGQLAAVAAAAAIRAGLDFELAVPLRGGAATLPTLGRARLPGTTAWGTATVRRRPGGYLVTGRHGSVPLPHDPRDGAGGWDGLRRLSFEHDTRSVTVYLDDLDPYRDCHGFVSAGRLTDDEFRSWAGLLDGAWAELVRHHPERVDELAARPVVLVPLAARSAGSPGTSATARDSAGAMALTPPPDSFSLAMSMVHEVQHSKLGALLDLVELYDRNDARRFYSPWRADPRPLSGLLQGAYAFAAVADFWRVYAAPPTGAAPAALAGYELARIRGQVGDALARLAGSGALTAAGERFVAGQREAFDGLDRVPVPERTSRLARLVNEDHRASWRLRNVLVEPEVVEALADAWLRGGGPPADRRASRVVDGAAPFAAEPRDQLVQRVVADRPFEAGPGDRALLAGDYAAAAEAFVDEVRAHPERDGAWVGLAVARARYGSQDAARVYAAEPELLRALYTRLDTVNGRANPDRLARWLAG